MTGNDESLIDKVKNALGMGHDDRDEHSERTESGVPADRPMDDRNDTWGVDGAAQATGREGASGGTGSSAALGGAGAAGPTGADPDPSLDAASDSDTDDERVDTGTVRTEYEMGHELDPGHETRAESGVLGGSAEDEEPRRDRR